MDGGVPLAAAGPAAEAPWSPVLPLARRRRGWGKAVAFLLLTVVPTAVAAAYLFLAASDQYVSEFRFTVRQSQPARAEAPSITEGLLAGTPLAAAADAEVAVHYLRSHQILLDLAGSIDLNALYARPDVDWLARLDPEESAEGRARHWRRFVDATLDRTSGLVLVQVAAFAPEDAQRVAAAALAASERLVNTLSERLRQDRLADADQEVDRAEARLRRAALALAAYRNRNGVLFPAMHAAENTGIDGRVRGQLLQADAALAAMRTQGLSSGAPQVRAMQSRADALRAEQLKLAAQLTQRDPADAGASPQAPPADQPALASLLGGYEQLQVEQTLAERAYDRAVLAQRQAQAQAAQQQVYLAAFVQPNLPQEPLRPRRWRLLAEVALGGFALWALACLLYYGIREHLD